MQKPKKEKDFLNLPVLTGGAEAFRKIIEKNMRYPEKAKAHKVEGMVYIQFTVNDNGKVQEAEVQKGLGYGCDEEALRLIRLVQFDKVRNRGVRVKANYKTRIRFKLPDQPKYNYSYSAKKNEQQNTENTPKKDNNITITYNLG